MHTYQVIFTIKQAIHPITEVVDATSVEQVKELVKQMCIDAGVTLKQITAVIQTK